MKRSVRKLSAGICVVALCVILLVDSLLRSSKPQRTTGGAGDDAQQPTWSERWDACAGQPERHAVILAEAAQQHAETRALMQRAPQAVFDVAMGLAEHDALPKELQPYFPVIFSGRGNLDNLWETGLCAHGSKHCHGTSILRLPGETLHLHQGAKGLVPVLHDVPVAGVRLGKDAVLATGASLPLETKDLFFLGGETATMQDPLTGRVGKPQHTLYFAGQALLFYFQKLILKFVLILMSLATYLAPISAASRDENVLIVGANIGNVPWEFQDTAGELIGFEIDLVNEVAKRLNRYLAQ